MENEFKQYEMDNKLNPSEELIIQKRLDKSFESNMSPKSKTSIFNNVFFKMFLVLILVFGIGLAVILINPSINTSNNNIAVIQSVRADEILNKMILTLEGLKKDANLAFMHYKYSSNEKDDYTNKDIYVYKDLNGKGYSSKTIRTANEENVPIIQDDGSIMYRIFSPQIQYFMQNGKNDYSFITDVKNVNPFIVNESVETDNASIWNVNPTKTDPIELFANNYKLITDNLDLIGTDNAELITFSIDDENIPAYKINFGFDYQNWMYSTNSYIDSKYNIEIIVSKETFLPLRETIKGFGTDNAPLEIQVDYIDFTYENRTAEETSKLFDINTVLAGMDYTDYKIEKLDEKFSSRSYYDTSKEVVYEGSVIAKNIGEKYVLPTLKVDSTGDEIFLQGDSMYDWLSEKPTTMGYYIIGKRIVIKGYLSEVDDYKQLLVNSFELIN